MADETSDFWQHHSDEYLKMAFRADRSEILENPDGYGKNTGDCGDTVEIYLTVEEDHVRWVNYMTQGCINTRACAGTVSLLAEGISVPEAWEIKPEDVISYLKTLPEASEHCAELAVGALYRALAQYRTHLRDPWKKVYRKR